MYCKKCSTTVNSSRVHLGFDTCINCSDTQKYSAHIVYPHKTGAIVQPVQEETKRNIQRLDRRSANGNKKAKGIFSDRSWDRWLDTYYNNQPTEKISQRKFPKLSHMKTETLYQTIVKEFIEWGYHRAVEKVNKLYADDKISLVQKGKMSDNLSSLQMMSSKEKKFFNKLENKKKG